VGDSNLGAPLISFGDIDLTLLLREKSSDELLGRLVIVSVVAVVRKGRLRWYEHVERKESGRLGVKVSEVGGSGVQG